MNYDSSEPMTEATFTTWDPTLINYGSYETLCRGPVIGMARPIK